MNKVKTPFLDECRDAAERIFSLAQGTPFQVFIRIKKGLLARFANNGVHQNGFQDLFSYVLRILGDKDTAWVESNDISVHGIQEALRRLREAVPRQVGSARKHRRKGVYPKVEEQFSLDIRRIPAMAAQTIEEAVHLIRRRQASANGYFSAYQRLFYLRDRHGFEMFHPATAVRFGTTITKGAGKGYLSSYHPDPRKLEVIPVVEGAMRFAEEASRGEIELRPGEYECVFSPRAFLELVEPLRRHFDLYLTREGKSVFSGLVGKKIFSKSFTLRDDVHSPGQFGVPFDLEGAPRRPRVLVQHGVLKELLGEGSSTRGLSEHPFNPQNLTVEKGKLSLNEIFRGIRRGIFINKIWYHTLVRESRMEVTGLATAASLYIERGRVLGRAVHLRYHDSIFSILNSVAGASHEQVLLKDGEMGAALFPYLWVGRLRVV